MNDEILTKISTGWNKLSLSKIYPWQNCPRRALPIYQRLSNFEKISAYSLYQWIFCLSDDRTYIDCVLSKTEKCTHLTNGSWKISSKILSVKTPLSFHESSESLSFKSNVLPLNKNIKGLTKHPLLRVRGKRLNILWVIPFAKPVELQICFLRG